MKERQQYAMFVVLSLAAAGMTGLLSAWPDSAGLFAPYFGRIPPLLAIGITAGLGLLSLGFLVSRGWFQIRTARSLRGVRFAAAIAMIFGVWQAGVDLFGQHFPRDVNVPAPQSLLFYPAMAYVVEVLFHVVPLALLLVVLSLIPETLKPRSSVIIWSCIVVVAGLEPVLVHMRMGASTYVGVFVFVFTLVELDIFRRYDFVAMYALRLTYYLWWHIIWGTLRLRWLF